MHTSMKFFVWVAAIAAFLSLSLDAEPSAAQQPVRYSRRPLTLPAANIRVDGQFQFLSVDRGPGGDVGGGRDNALSLLGGVAAGFTDNFELGGVIMPLLLSPDVKYQNPSFYGLYRLLDSGVFEIGVFGQVVLPVDPYFALQAGLPILIRAGDVVRLNTGAFLGFYFSDPILTGFDLPLQLAIQASESFFIGPEMGLCLGSIGRQMLPPQMADTCTNGGLRDIDNLAIPLGVFAGYSFPGSGGNALGDLRFGFKSVDIQNGFDAFVFHAGANFYFSL